MGAVAPKTNKPFALLKIIFLNYISALIEKPKPPDHCLPSPPPPNTNSHHLKLSNFIPFYQKDERSKRVMPYLPLTQNEVSFSSPIISPSIVLVVWSLATVLPLRLAYCPRTGHKPVLLLASLQDITPQKTSVPNGADR
jgi:hypothetical protein